MENVTLETMERDARDFLEKKKRRPLIVAIKAALIIFILLILRLTGLWLEENNLTVVFLLFGAGTCFFIISDNFDWKIPVKVKQTEINLILPSFLKVNQERLAEERNSLYNLIESYKDFISDTENEMKNISSNLEELKKIKEAFEKAREID